MNNKSILKSIGIIFLLITTSAFSREKASGQQKNNSTTIDNLSRESIPLRARVTIFYAYEKVYSKKLKKWVYNSDKNTDAGKTAALVDIKTLQDIGLEVLSVNPAIIPWGSVGSFIDNNGDEKIGVAVDKGSAVVSAKASGGKTPVIDIYSKKAKTGDYHDFRIIKYTGPNFKTKLNDAQRLQHLQRIRDAFVISKNHHLAKR